LNALEASTAASNARDNAHAIYSLQPHDRAHNRPVEALGGSVGVQTALSRGCISAMLAACWLLLGHLEYGRYIGRGAYTTFGASWQPGKREAVLWSRQCGHGCAIHRRENEGGCSRIRLRPHMPLVHSLPKPQLSRLPTEPAHQTNHFTFSLRSGLGEYDTVVQSQFPRL
jgi:hypothetical protein